MYLGTGTAIILGMHRLYRQFGKRGVEITEKYEIKYLQRISPIFKDPVSIVEALK